VPDDIPPVFAPAPRLSILLIPALVLRCVPFPIHPIRPSSQEDLSANCVAAESVWTLEDGVLLLTLTKARKAETWPSVFQGHGELDAASVEAAHKQMLLERFQAENPGFDFSQATINGQVPDPRVFMGGPSGLLK
jgi:hypothetical protein